jgi:rhamnose utilization protein RhaD (predicted bifunctional aldolase and dehydrogenase)
LKSLWNDNDTVEFKDDLDYRVYTSNLLGRSDEVLYVKGSGWDLVSIERPGFPAVELNFLQDMAKVESLSDSEMVAGQREAMMDKPSPNPSVEAILHAIIPFKYVDHTHADAVVTLSNNINGEKIIKELYPNYLIMPYIMPGFILAREVYLATKDLDWSQCEGIILHNHGIFTFDDDAKISYEKMIDAVTIAENHLEQNATLDLKEINPIELNIESLIQIIQDSKGFELSYKINQSPLALNYSMQDPEKLVQGVLTPEHIIRTKRHPLVLEADSTIQNELDNYIKEYTQYFEEFSSDEIMLNPTPNYCVIKGYGIVSFGKNEKEVTIIDDIITHTMKAVMQAQILGAYQSISLKDSFAMEYWELEQAKLK